MSKNIIFYFSGTGNSLEVAKQLKFHLDDTDTIPIIQSEPINVGDGILRVGLVYPIYVNAVPKVVLDFIKANKNIFKGFTFAVATHGGIPGIAGLNLIDNMSKLDIKLSAYYEVEMINNTPKGVAPKPLMHLNWEKEITSELIQKMLTDTESKVKSISMSLLDNESSFEIGKSKILNNLKLTFMNAIWKMSEKKPLKVVFILDESCIGCGNCAKVCTTSRIQLLSSKPQWIHDNCNCCYACFNFCPKQAIGVKHYTKKLGRYHHPNIDINEITKQNE